MMEPPSYTSVSIAVRAIARLPRDGRKIVGVDGVDGAGKTTFADALAARLDRPSVRASVDDFHNPRAVRYSRGRQSPEGFYLDSFDLAALTRLLLAPFARGERFCRHAFDHTTDRAVPVLFEHTAPDAVLVLDGLFLHRSELREWWDLSILLDVTTATAAERMRARDGRAPGPRYVGGQELYFAETDPRTHASLVLPW